MRLAIEQARAAQAWGDVPIGAVVVRGEEVIAAAGNRRWADKDPTAHAEMLAIRAAAQRVGDRRLEGCWLYVSLEPCAMSPGPSCSPGWRASSTGRPTPRPGRWNRCTTCWPTRLNHRPTVIGGVLAQPCGAMLTEFFQAQRRLGKK